MHSKKKVAVFWDGSVESTLALKTILNDENIEIKTLFSILSKSTNEIPFSGVPEVLIKSQMTQFKLPLIRIYLDDEKANSFEFENIDNFINLFIKSSIEIISLPFTTRKESGSCQLEVIYPNLTNDKYSSHVKFLEGGNRAIITAVNETHVPIRYLGKELSKEVAKELKNKESYYNTFTTFCPNFKSRIAFSKNITVSQPPFTVCKLREA